MIECKILRSFPFSRDGIIMEHANAGTTVQLPARLVQGLCKAAYVAVAPAQTALNAVQTAPVAASVAVTPTQIAKPWEQGAKAMAAAPENKAISIAPEIKVEPKVVEEDYRTVETGAGWSTVYQGEKPVIGVRKLRTADVRVFNRMTREERVRFVKSEIK
jgi:hypothetical protein